MWTVLTALSLAGAALPAQGDSNPFGTALNVLETERIALTPVLDGKLTEDEWDPFATSNGAQTYFQWEPEHLHAAGTLATGQELVLSLDRSGNGWLVGKDNLEVRLRFDDGKASVHARWLDATDPAGPKWIAAPEFEAAASFAWQVTGSTWNAELSVRDPGTQALPRFPGTKFGVRVDAAPSSGAGGTAAFLPRAVAMVSAGTQRATNEPAGFRWLTDVPWPTLGPGSQWKARLSFRGNNELGLDKVDVRVLSAGGEDYAAVSSPFPRFDNKGRSFIDYSSPIPRGARPGYRNLVATVTDKSGQRTLCRLAFRVLPAVFFDPVLDGGVRNKETGLRLRLPIHVSNRTPEKIAGQYSVAVPAGWSIEEGGDRNITLKGFNSDARRVLILNVPAGATGSFPITFTFDAGNRKYEQVEWVAVGEALPKKK